MKHRFIMAIGVLGFAAGACSSSGDAGIGGPTVGDAIERDHQPPPNDQQPPSSSFASEQPAANENQPQVNEDQPLSSDPSGACQSFCAGVAAACGGAVAGEIDCEETCADADFGEIAGLCPAEIDAVFECFEEQVEILCAQSGLGAEADFEEQFGECEESLRDLAECASGYDLGDVSIFGEDMGQGNGNPFDGPPDIPNEELPSSDSESFE